MQSLADRSSLQFAVRVPLLGFFRKYMADNHANAEVGLLTQLRDLISYALYVLRLERLAGKLNVFHVFFSVGSGLLAFFLNLTGAMCVFWIQVNSIQNVVVVCEQ